MNRRTPLSSSRAPAALAALSILSVAACSELPIALGDENSIIVSADPEIWAQVEPSLMPVLERTVFTVRDEKTFTVTHHDPADEAWRRLRLLKQQLAIGTAADPWMADALAKADDPPSAGVFQVRDVWARGQSVTAVLLEDGQGADAVTEHAWEVAELLDSQYRAWAVSKMFVTGRNDELNAMLSREARFSLVVPTVYEYSMQGPVHLFRNDNPDPSELIRQVAVTWESPIPEGMQPEDLIEWRERIVAEHYSFPQVNNLANATGEAEVLDGFETYTVRAVWENPPDEYPAAGPFVLRAVHCREQDRMYLIDAWLYAPGAEKYEYMIQLEEIMNSFSCAGL